MIEGLLMAPYFLSAGRQTTNLSKIMLELVDSTPPPTITACLMLCTCLRGTSDCLILAVKDTVGHLTCLLCLVWFPFTSTLLLMNTSVYITSSPLGNMEWLCLPYALLQGLRICSLWGMRTRCEIPAKASSLEESLWGVWVRVKPRLNLELWPLKSHPRH